MKLKKDLKRILSKLAEWFEAVFEVFREWLGFILYLIAAISIVYGVFLVWGAGISFIVFGLISAILGVLYNIDDRQ